MIAVSRLSFSYTPETSIQFPDFSVQKGEHCLLLGESGSGKTTLLHLLGGLLRNKSGSIVVDDTELSGLSEAALDRFRGQRMGFIFQRNHLISALSVEKNLMMSPYLAGLPLNTSRIDEVLSYLGLSAKRNSKSNRIKSGTGAAGSDRESRVKQAGDTFCRRANFSVRR